MILPPFFALFCRVFTTMSRFYNRLDLAVTALRSYGSYKAKDCNELNLVLIFLCQTI